MSWLVLVRPKAERDAACARDWYDAQREGLGDEFLYDLDIALRALTQDPDRERLYFRNFRRKLLKRLPYKVFYQVIGARVVVFRVLHAKRDYARQLWT